MALRLGDFATTPLYNIKAVVQATGISPSTLRAWERRYNIARPERSESGYRLYSERDVAVIRWLKAQVDAGMSISQAVSWFDKILAEAGEAERAILPTPGSGAALTAGVDALPDMRHYTQSQGVRDLKTFQQELIRVLSCFDEEAAEQVIAEAFSLYTVEQVGEKLFQPVLLEISERRRQGSIGITIEHFAGSYLTQRLCALLRATPSNKSGPLIWVGCAHTQTYDACALLISIYLRRSGYHVKYLGQHLPTEEEDVREFIQDARRYQPALILLSACTGQAAAQIGQLSLRLTQSAYLPAAVGYGGAIYARHPELRAKTAGVFVGAEINELLENIDQLLASRQRAENKYNKQATDQTNSNKTPNRAPNRTTINNQ